MYINKSELDCTYIYISVQASLVAQLVKNLPAIWETWVRSLGWEDPLEKGKATHSSILAWRIPWTVQSMESQGVGHFESCDFHSLTYIYSSTCMVMYTVNISERINKKFLIMVTSGY